MRTHGEAEVAAFFDIGSGAMSTWALYRAADDAPGEPTFMAAGDGERFRADTAAGKYRCVVPDCSGLLRVKAGRVNRHHWAHRVAPVPAHAPESLWHLNAKAAIRDFVRRRHPDATILVDERYTPAGNRPDVWASTQAFNIAFEVQISALDGREFHRRDDRYGEDLITAVWLFAHLHPPKLPGARSAQPEVARAVRLRDVHRQLASLGRPVRWLNPDERKVATAFVVDERQLDERAGELWAGRPPRISCTRHPTGGDAKALIFLDDLDECTLDAEGLHAPADVWIRAQQTTEVAKEETLREAARANFVRWADSRHKPAEPPPATAMQKPPEPRLSAAGQKCGSWSGSPPGWEVEPVREKPPGGLPLGERPCPVCAGSVSSVTSWPQWYRPPATATLVLVCDQCGTILGSR